MSSPQREPMTLGIQVLLAFGIVVLSALLPVCVVAWSVDA
jgi:hypothetical protein